MGSRLHCESVIITVGLYTVDKWSRLRTEGKKHNLNLLVLDQRFRLSLERYSLGLSSLCLSTLCWWWVGQVQAVSVLMSVLTQSFSSLCVLLPDIIIEHVFFFLLTHFGWRYRAPSISAAPSDAVDSSGSFCDWVVQKWCSAFLERCYWDVIVHEKSGLKSLPPHLSLW